MSMYFRAQSRHYSYTWSCRERDPQYAAILLAGTPEERGSFVWQTPGSFMSLGAKSQESWRLKPVGGQLPLQTPRFLGDYARSPKSKRGRPLEGIPDILYGGFQN